MGIYSGVSGIAAGIALVLIHWGIFADHADETTLGMVVFLAGYVAVINGCWWWTTAKAWPEVLALVGLLPLGILFIPAVRLMFLRVPALLVLAMVMLPLALIVVVFALPDKSGVSRRARSQASLNRVGDS